MLAITSMLTLLLCTPVTGFAGDDCAAIEVEAPSRRRLVVDDRVEEGRARAAGRRVPQSSQRGVGGGKMEYEGITLH